VHVHVYVPVDQYCRDACRPHTPLSSYYYFIQIEELCAAETTSALPTIFHRAITECDDDDQVKFESAVLPAMVRLMATLLNKSNGISSTSVAETQTVFETLLKQARRIFLLGEPDADDFAGRVSRFLVLRISLAIGEPKAASASETKGLKLDTGTSSLMASNSVDKGIAELLSQREMHSKAAKRSSMMVRSACSSLTANGSTPMTNGSARDTEIEKSDILLALVGVDAKNTFEQRKLNLDEVKAQVKEGESQRLQELRTSSDELHSEREMIQQRITELKLSIEKLKTYDAELCAKVSDVEKEIEEECTNESADASRLHEQVTEASKAVKFGTSVGSLVDMLKRYDDALDKAINGTVESLVIDEDIEAEASKQMDAFLSRARSYFASEAQCVDSLRNRIRASQMEVPELVSSHTLSSLASSVCVAFVSHYVYCFLENRDFGNGRPRHDYNHRADGGNTESERGVDRDRCGSRRTFDAGSCFHV
jgi:hypothetical protein